MQIGIWKIKNDGGSVGRKEWSGIVKRGVGRERKE